MTFHNYLSMGKIKLGSILVDFVRHACVVVSFGGKTIYFDPWKIPQNPPKADIIFVSHEHYDHCSKEAIKQVSKQDTIIVTNEKCKQKLEGNIKTLKICQTIELHGLKATAAEAYNIGKKFHPKGLGMGFVVSLGDEKIYHAGDTDFIPEMKKLQGITIAFVPIGGTYTMDETEAAQAVNSFKPTIAIPMHYNVVEGTQADPNKFKQMVEKPTRVEVAYE